VTRESILDRETVEISALSVAVLAECLLLVVGLWLRWTLVGPGVGRHPFVYLVGHTTGFGRLDVFLGAIAGLGVLGYAVLPGARNSYLTLTAGGAGSLALTLAVVSSEFGWGFATEYFVIGPGVPVTIVASALLVLTGLRGLWKAAAEESRLAVSN
jgi:hypothetical protein